MNNDNTISNEYRSTRRILQAVAIISILWSIAQVELSSISFDSIATITFSKFSIPILLLFSIVFFSYHSIYDFIQQSTSVRRSKSARLDFQISFYLTLVSILSLSISIESRSIISLLSLLSLSIPFLFLASLFGTLFGFLYLMIRLKLFPRKGRGIAAYVTELFIMSEFIMKCLFILALLSIGILYSFTNFLSFYNFRPSIVGVWSSIAGFSFTIAIFTIRHGFFNRLFCFQIYDHTTETLRYFDKHGNQTMSFCNVNENGKWTGKPSAFDSSSKDEWSI